MSTYRIAAPCEGHVSGVPFTYPAGDHSPADEAEQTVLEHLVLVGAAERVERPKAASKKEG